MDYRRRGQLRKGESYMIEGSRAGQEGPAMLARAEAVAVASGSELQFLITVDELTNTQRDEAPLVTSPE